MSDQTPTSSGIHAQAAPAGTSDEAAPAQGGRRSGHDRASYAPALNRGYSSAMSRGLELAATLVVMVGIGLLVDRIFGTYPAFTIVFSVLGFAGITAKLWLGYDLEMRKQEEGAIWNRGKEAAS